MHQEKRKGGRAPIVYDTELGAKELLVLSFLHIGLIVEVVIPSCNLILDSGRHLQGDIRQRLEQS